MLFLWFTIKGLAPVPGPLKAKWTYIALLELLYEHLKLTIYAGDEDQQ